MVKKTRKQMELKTKGSSYSLKMFKFVMKKKVRLTQFYWLGTNLGSKLHYNRVPKAVYY
jgi:hypothetical protein